MNKILIILMLFYTSTLYACIECNGEPIITIQKQAIPKFPDSFQSNEPAGSVTFKVIMPISNSIRKITIVDLFPKNTPKEPILEMIKNTKYFLKYARGTEFGCPAINHEVHLIFLIPKKLELEIDLDLGLKK